MTFKSLKEKLAHQILEDGPLSVGAYMAACLSDPDFGYYCRNDPLGVEGDFITAPEVHQIFGDMVGVWFLDLWLQCFRERPIAFLELGPGRGTLMADIMRVWKKHLAARGYAHQLPPIHLVEMNQTLRDVQKTRLTDFEVRWHTSLAEALAALDGCVIFSLANEFFDALPVEQLIYHQGGWHKRLVSYNPETERFSFIPGEEVVQAPAGVLARPQEGDLWEYSPASEAIMNTWATYLKTYGGMGLISDYGYTKPGFGETLQALKSHQFSDVFDTPGQQDLTAHVNFQTLIKVAQDHNLSTCGLQTQGAFLKSLGIEVRAAQLMKRATPVQQKDLQEAVRRLTGADQMGTLFKVMAFGEGTTIADPL